MTDSRLRTGAHGEGPKRSAMEATAQKWCTMTLLTRKSECTPHLELCHVPDLHWRYLILQGTLGSCQLQATPEHNGGTEQYCTRPCFLLCFGDLLMCCMTLDGPKGHIPLKSQQPSDTLHPLSSSFDFLYSFLHGRYMVFPN